MQIAHAQSAQITGRVTDPSGAVVSRAEIEVTHVETGVRNTSVTNDSGIYVVPFLPPGTYAVKVSLTGFKSITRSA
ncbi:MAG TPA: carboxypeptidase-like regulatory domain-containing protein, partial [Bryobacteraceae bacterium]|nr:carboxypeptidase-like regulatory domain-containing protein [Bryobacteraceae bacterium]